MLVLRKYPGRLSYLPIVGYRGSVDSTPIKPVKITRSITVDGSQLLSDKQHHQLMAEGGSKSAKKERLFSSPKILKNIRKGSLKSKKKMTSDGSRVSLDADLEKTDNGLVDVAMEAYEDLGFKDSNGHTMAENASSSEIESSGDVPYGEVPEFNKPVPEEWVSIEDDFILIYATTTSHICDGAPFAPSEFNDGIIWLTFITGDVTRGQLLTFLRSMESGEHSKLSWVQRVPVKAFRLEPKVNKGYMTVDGERIDVGTVQGEMMASVATLLC